MFLLYQLIYAFCCIYSPIAVLSCQGVTFLLLLLLVFSNSLGNWFHLDLSSVGVAISRLLLVSFIRLLFLFLSKNGMTPFAFRRICNLLTFI